MSCDHDFGDDKCPKCGVDLLPDGCGYQGYEFGAANYPDSICYGGRLWDADNCNSDGNLFEPGEYIPCPMCNRNGAVDYWADRNRLGGTSAKEARKAARSLVDDIRANRKIAAEEAAKK